MLQPLRLANFLLTVAVLSSACGLGGEGGTAELAFTVDNRVPSQPVLEAVAGPVAVGESVLVRLELPSLSDATSVRVRLEKRVGTSFLQRGDVDYPVRAPWRVVVLPVTIEEPGHWNIALIVNSRKLTDVEVDVERR